MKTKSALLVAISLICVGVVSTSCSNGVDVPDAKVVKTTDASAMPEQGKGGVKAANGGGMVPQPRTAAPGEKTGIPK